MVFSSLGVFQENENVLRPYLNHFVAQTLSHAMRSRYCLNYFAILRMLFRSIGGGKFEVLYKEFVPFLPELLFSLSKMQDSGPDEVRDVCVELCLTVPARLSTLLPHIPLLMKCVSYGLKSRDESVIKLGLRTIEFWIDYLKPEYLYPYMEEVGADIFRSLCSLARPMPTPYGSHAMNILGKLGGKNRRFLIDPMALQSKVEAEDGFSLLLRFLPNDPFVLPAEPVLDLVRGLLRRVPPEMRMGSEDRSVREQAFNCLRAAVISVLDLANVNNSDVISNLGDIMLSLIHI